MWPLKSRVQKEREAKILRINQNLRCQYEMLEYTRNREIAILSIIAELKQILGEDGMAVDLPATGSFLKKVAQALTNKIK